MIRVLLLASLLFAVPGACVSAPRTDPAQLSAGSFTLDPAHASVTWRIRHMGLSWYTARFDTAEASLEFDPDDPAGTRLTAIVDASSVSTGDQDFDATLRGPAWFAAERHPQIVFRSTLIEPTGETTGRVHGDLTLKGVTREIILETEFYGGLFNPLEGRQALGFGADVTLDRTDFGVGSLPGNLIGDEVRIQIEAEFLQGED